MKILFTQFFAPDDGAGGGGGGGDGAVAEGAEGKEGLLSGEGGAGAEGKEGLLSGEGGKEAKPDATPEQIDEFLKDVDLKYTPEGSDTEVELDREGLKAVAPILLKLGASKEDASALSKAFAEHQGKAAQAQLEADDKAIAKMADEAKSHFGNDFGKALNLAKKGGPALFGPELWGELSRVPVFSNDKRVIEALARFGASIKSDDGIDGKDAGQENKGDFVSRWTKSKG